MRKINIGIVGTGLAAENHYKILKKKKIFNVKSICGKNAKRLKLRNKSWKLNIYNDVKKMINNENLEAVVICNQNNLHYSEAKKAVNSGVHILIEKPIDANIKKSIELVNICKREKKILAVVMQKRFDLATNFLKKLIKEKYFGKIVSVKLDVFMHRNKEYFSKRKWLKNSKNIGGGITIHHAIHSIDQIIYMLDKNVRSVSFWKSNYIRKLPFEDTSGGWIKFENNIIATINCSVCAYPKLKNRIEIIGNKNALLLEKDKIFKLPVKKNGSFKVLKKFRYSDLGNYGNVWDNFGYAIKKK